jgi:hypothetical protein
MRHWHLRRRLTGAILLLYPRRVREGHGPEIVALIDDLIRHEGRARAGLLARLAADGLGQRLASIATVWTVVAVLAATSFGGLAVSELAAASSLPSVRQTLHTTAPARHATTPARHAPQRRRHPARRVSEPPRAGRAGRR